MRLRNLRLLCAAALASSLLSSASCSSVSEGLWTQAAPPRPTRPCELPFLDKAEDLAPQPNITARLDGGDMALLWKNDAAQYNQLKPRFNKNIDWAAGHCVARPPPAPASVKPPGLIDRLNPF